MAITFSDLSGVPTPSDYRVDALVDDNDVNDPYEVYGYYWNWNVWSAASGETTMQYSFDASLPTGFSNSGYALEPFDANQQSAARSVMEQVSGITGIPITETNVASEAEFIFVVTNLDWRGAAALASSPVYSFMNGVGTMVGYAPGSIILDDDYVNPTVGSFGYEALLHEAGHMFGLEHPHEGPDALPEEEDHTDNTVMSYIHRTGYETEYEEYDLLAFDYLYGGDGLNGKSGITYDDPPAPTIAGTQTVTANTTVIAGSTAGDDALVLGDNISSWDVSVSGVEHVTGSGHDDRLSIGGSSVGGVTVHASNGADDINLIDSIGADTFVLTSLSDAGTDVLAGWQWGTDKIAFGGEFRATLDDGDGVLDVRSAGKKRVNPDEDELVLLTPTVGKNGVDDFASFNRALGKVGGGVGECVVVVSDNDTTGLWHLRSDGNTKLTASEADLLAVFNKGGVAASDFFFV